MDFSVRLKTRLRPSASHRLIVVVIIFIAVLATARAGHSQPELITFMLAGAQVTRMMRVTPAATGTQ